jgi:cell division GTPase FtsZ
VRIGHSMQPERLSIRHLLDMNIDGAKGVLFNITGGKDLGMYEVDEAAKFITKSVDSDARIIFGAVIDEEWMKKSKSQ